MITISKEYESKTWDPNFGPSYTPLEMLDKGIFEGLYTAAIPDIPNEYKTHKNVLPRGSDPDISINFYGVKSRLSLNEWREKGWLTKDSPLGWWGWYVHYYLGRRLGEEDKWQIGRWRSFVARHQGQISAKCKLDDVKCNTRQRQGLLQWAWDSTEKYSDEKVLSNAKAIAKKAGVKLADDTKIIISKEQYQIPKVLKW